MVSSWVSAANTIAVVSEPEAAHIGEEEEEEEVGGVVVASDEEEMMFPQVRVITSFDK
jgi:hypothetical protein